MSIVHWFYNCSFNKRNSSFSVLMFLVAQINWCSSIHCWWIWSLLNVCLLSIILTSLAWIWYLISICLFLFVTTSSFPNYIFSYISIHSLYQFSSDFGMHIPDKHRWGIESETHARVETWVAILKVANCLHLACIDSCDFMPGSWHLQMLKQWYIDILWHSQFDD